MLAKERPETKIVVCEPADAPLLGSGTAQERNPDGSAAAAHPAFKPHPMQGWTPDFIPKLTADAVDMHVIDRVIPILGPDAMRCSRELAQKEGIFVGISAGGTFAGALQVCREAAKGATVLCMLPDTGERYLSTPLVRRHPGRHDRGGARDLALDPDRADGRLTPPAAMSVVSTRIQAADTAFAAVKDFYFSSRYGERRLDPGICDFTFGNPHEMPLPGIVAALRERALPRDENWFAYKTSEAQPQEYLAGRLAQELNLAFEPADIALTTGAFAAIMVALRLLLDAGDEAVFCEPAWFCYEPMLLAADAVPIKLKLKPPGFDLDLDAIEAAIGPRTRLVIVNTPHNPTGRIYGRDQLAPLAALLERACARFGRPVFLLSDEPYRRLRFDGRDFLSPAALYPWTLISYSYGKVLLAPGQRLGYLAISPLMPASDRQALARRDVFRPDGARLVLPERGDAVRAAGSGRPLDRSGGAGPAARPADGGAHRRRLPGAAAGGHVLSLEQMARRRPRAHLEPARRSRRIRAAGQHHGRAGLFPHQPHRLGPDDRAGAAGIRAGGALKAARSISLQTAPGSHGYPA